MAFEAHVEDDYHVSVVVTGTETPHTLREFDMTGYASDEPPGLIIWFGENKTLTGYITPSDGDWVHNPSPADEGFVRLYVALNGGACTSVGLTGTWIDEWGEEQTSQETISTPGLATYASTRRYRDLDSIYLNGANGADIQVFQKRLGIIGCGDVREVQDDEVHGGVYFCDAHLSALYIGDGSTPSEFTLTHHDGPSSQFIRKSFVMEDGEIVVLPQGTLNCGLPTTETSGILLQANLIQGTGTSPNFGTINLCGAKVVGSLKIPKGVVQNTLRAGKPAYNNLTELDEPDIMFGDHSTGTTGQSITVENFEVHDINSPYGLVDWRPDVITPTGIRFLGVGEPLSEDPSDPASPPDKTLVSTVFSAANSPPDPEHDRLIHFRSDSKRRFIFRDTVCPANPTVRRSFAASADEDIHPLILFKSRLTLTVKSSKPQITATQWAQDGYPKTVTESALEGARVYLYDVLGNSVFRTVSGGYSAQPYVNDTETSITLSGGILPLRYYWLGQELLYYQSGSTFLRGQKGTTAQWHTNKVGYNHYFYSVSDYDTTDASGLLTNGYVDVTYRYLNLGASDDTGMGVNDVDVTLGPFTLVVMLEGFEPCYRTLDLEQDTELTVVLSPLTPHYDGIGG